MKETNKHGFPQEYAVWWTSEVDCKLINALVKDWKAYPAYIADEFVRRFGRHGRGRLWVHRKIPVDSLSQEGLQKIEAFNLPHAGIVIRAADIWHILSLPGFITDLNFDLFGHRV